MIDNSIENLDSFFREEYVEPFLAELMKERLYVVVIETRRSRERQQMLYKAGKSKATFGYHCNGQAIDLAPVGIYMGAGTVKSINWSITNPTWKKIADVAKDFDLVWGGNWISFPDYCHFQEPGALRREEPTLSAEELNALYEPGRVSVVNALPSNDIVGVRPVFTD